MKVIQIVVVVIMIIITMAITVRMGWFESMNQFLYWNKCDEITKKCPFFFHENEILVFLFIAKIWSSFEKKKKGFAMVKGIVKGKATFKKTTNVTYIMEIYSFLLL